MTEIIVEFPSPFTEREKKMIFGYKGELIRCKDCKHNKSNEWVDCPITEFFGRTLDNYCSLAERKEE